jgi:hypothetical protein
VQTDSIVDDDVEQNDVSQNIIQGLQNKTIIKDFGMEKADETTNVNGETSFIDPGKELSLQGGVEMNIATSLKGSSVILEDQNIEQDGETLIQNLLTMVDFSNDEDQASKSKEVEWNDDGDGGYGDNLEVENVSSDSSVKPSAKHIKTKSNKKFRIAAVEDDDDSSESCKSDNSPFSQTSSIKPQGDPKLLHLSGLSLLNSKESSSASAIDPSIKKGKTLHIPSFSKTRSSWTV